MTLARPCFPRPCVTREHACLSRAISPPGSNVVFWKSFARTALNPLLAKLWILRGVRGGACECNYREEKSSRIFSHEIKATHDQHPPWVWIHSMRLRPFLRSFGTRGHSSFSRFFTPATFHQKARGSPGNVNLHTPITLLYLNAFDNLVFCSPVLREVSDDGVRGCWPRREMELGLIRPDVTPPDPRAGVA